MLQTRRAAAPPKRQSCRQSSLWPAGSLSVTLPLLATGGCKGCLVDMLQPPPAPTKGAEAAQPPTCHKALPLLGEPKVPDLFLGVLRPVWVRVTLLQNVKEFPVAWDGGGLSGRLALAPGVLNPAVASGHGCWAIPDGVHLLLNGGSQVLQGPRESNVLMQAMGVSSRPNQLYRAGEHAHSDGASGAKG